MRILILIQIQLSTIQLRHHHQQVRPGEHGAAYSKFNFGKQLQAYSNPSHIFTQAENNEAVFRIWIGSGSSSIVGQCGSGSKSNSPPSNSTTTTSRLVQVNTALHIQNSTLNKCRSRRIRIHPTQAENWEKNTALFRIRHGFRIQHFRSMRIRILIQIQFSAIQLRHHHQQVSPGEHSDAYSKFFGKQLQAYSNPSHVFKKAGKASTNNQSFGSALVFNADPDPDPDPDPAF
jgi:hypothetical protein